MWGREEEETGGGRGEERRGGEEERKEESGKGEGGRNAEDITSPTSANLSREFGNSSEG